jgi:hypothetical protein
MGTVSIIDSRFLPSSELPGGFQYPAAFLQYLLFEKREFGDEDERHVLRWIWPDELHYEAGRVAHTMAAFMDANPGRTDFYLVPFAHDAGDGVWFFAPDGVYFIDMGWEKWVLRREPDEDFQDFVNRQRQASYLPPWRAD